MSRLEITKTQLILDGAPFYLASGDIHYFRFLEGEWERRLQLARNFGLTAIQTYAPWNLHEPKEGTFCFEGNLNLSGFLDLCAAYGLKVLFRPSPYIVNSA